jgi:three-Cys-motif partner protein
MAKKPTTSRWATNPRTEAKHKILEEYLAAWVPIFGHQRNVKDIVVIDGFAGPGRSSGGEKGSPLLMLDAYARRADRSTLGVTAHYFFIEKEKIRVQDLESEIAKRKPATDIDINVIHGDYGDEFPRLVDRIRKTLPGAPIFAFIDPFGAPVKPELATELLALPKCEVLMFVPIGYLADFFAAEDMRNTLKSLFGREVFDRCRNEPPAGRRAIMVELIEEKLKKSSKWVRAFELLPAGGGGRTHFLFFGTNNAVGLARMKSAMWKLDPIGGQRFKDSTAPQDSVLFEPEPDFLPLRRALEEKFGDGVFTIEEAEDFTLFETPFLHDAHLKRKTLAAAEREGKLVPVNPAPERRKSTYKEGTRLRLDST